MAVHLPHYRHRHRDPTVASSACPGRTPAATAPTAAAGFNRARELG